MRRAASSALPSYAPDGRQASDSASTSPTTGSAWQSRAHWWLLFYVVLGFYALAVFSGFVLNGTHATPDDQQKPVLQDHSQVLLQYQQKVAVPGPIKIETIAKETDEPEEGWPIQDVEEGAAHGAAANRELEQQEQLQEASPAIEAGEDEQSVAMPAQVTVPITKSQVTVSHATPAPVTTAAITPSATPTISEEQSPKEDIQIPTRQQDVVMLTVDSDIAKDVKAEEKPSELVDMKVPRDSDSEKGELLKDPNEAEADMRPPQEKWEVDDSAKNEVIETQSPVRRSDDFLKALDLVYLPETKPPNPHFHISPANKNSPGDDAAVVSGLRNTVSDRSVWTVEGYQHELDRLEALKQEATDETERLKLLISAANKLIVEEKDQLEDKRSASTLDIRSHQPRKIRNNLKCMGWRQTGQCSPYGKREPSSDLACNQIAQGGVSGYCEVLDQDTGELFRVMQLNCSSLRSHVVFSCAEAADFANFGILAQNVYQEALTQNDSYPLQLLGNTGTGNGIVMVVYPKLLTSVFASISVLRSYNCTLPIELWISQPEMVRTPSMRQTLDMLQQRFSNVTVETILDPTIAGFSTKIHAVQHSKFENVLFLDADNVPVRDPTFLFESQEFREHGALFWPDFWHPEKTIFNIQRDSLLWELVDLPFVDMFEQESGQVLISRKRAAVAMEVLMFFAYHRPSHFERLVLAHGDKDLFRLAWIKTRTPFYMMPFPPATAGTVRGTYKQRFCGMTMVQFDVNGEVLFLHRNAKKLDGNVIKLDPTYWTHMQTFKWEQVGSDGADDDITFPANRTAVQRLMSYDDIKKKYQIGIQASGLIFKDFESCYGAELTAVDNFNMTKFEDLPFANLEQELIDYAHEAAVLMAHAH